MPVVNFKDIEWKKESLKRNVEISAFLLFSQYGTVYAKYHILFQCDCI